MANRLLLVGWDAADWKILHPLIDAGEMPALCRIVETGASGALLSVQPMVPVAQWTSIATGKRPWQHRVCHPAIATRSRSFSLWEILGKAGKRSLVVGWPATHGSQPQNTVLVSERYAHPTAAPNIKPWPPAPPGTYWPREIGGRLDPLRMSPQDVQADVISRYIPDWKKIDQNRDRRLGQLRLFLATDFSYQAAMMSLLSGGNWDFAAVRFPALGAISPIFLPEAEVGLYQNVIRNACRRLDSMLRLLVQAAGTSASIVVVSPHGVNQRPGPVSDNEAWKSPHGIFAACGSAFASDALVFGATALDVTPTILTYFGLPIGDDMEGRVLLESFAKPPEVTRVPSWEQTPSAIPEDTVCPDESIRREADLNLARSYLDAARYEEARVVLERLFRAFPERADLAHSLFHCQLTLARHADAAETLEVLLEGVPPGIWSILPRAELCVARKQFSEARSLVSQALHLRPTHPDALRRLGMLLLRLREWSALAELTKQALKLDDNEPLAWLGLAEAQLRKKLAAEAEEAAMRAIGLNYYMPQAHFVLARAFIAQGKWDQARETMQALLQLQPNNRAAATYASRIREPSLPS
jgi:tetratricopeptide (TPR) repeat protein